jgi:hypothetical protein
VKRSAELICSLVCVWGEELCRQVTV